MREHLLFTCTYEDAFKNMQYKGIPLQNLSFAHLTAGGINLLLKISTSCNQCKWLQKEYLQLSYKNSRVPITDHTYAIEWGSISNWLTRLMCT